MTSEITVIEGMSGTGASVAENRRFNSVSSHHQKQGECHHGVTKHITILPSDSPLLVEFAQKLGSPAKRPSFKRLSQSELFDWFWGMSRLNAATGCWEWTGRLSGADYRNPDRYGRFEWSGRRHAVHRFAARIVLGEMPKCLVCHQCDNTRCVNPSHLFLGTHRDNILDSVIKGRWRGGRKRFTSEQALTIKKRVEHDEPIGVLAKEYRVSEGTILRIAGILTERHRKLSPEQCLEITREYCSNKITTGELAKRYGVNPTTIGRVVHLAILTTAA